MTDYYWFTVLILINAVVLFVLTANVSRLRIKLRISVGDGGDNNMLYAIRAQSNGVEQVPIFSLIILALSFLESSSVILSSLTVLFSVARVFHAYGMLGKVYLCRRIGAGLTYLLQLLAIVILAFEIFV